MNAPTRLERRLEKVGWTLARALEEPDEVYPIPSPPFPPDRVYHFVDDRNIALIVKNGVVIGSVPGPEAWEILQEYGPSPTGEHDDDMETVLHYQGTGGWILRGADLSAPWTVQTIITKNGTWTVHALRKEGGAILLNKKLITLYQGPEDLGFDFPAAVIEAAWIIEDQKTKKKR